MQSIRKQRGYANVMATVLSNVEVFGSSLVKATAMNGESLAEASPAVPR